jgi:hypothetical protein
MPIRPVIKGRVLDLQGNPIVGANVMVGTRFGANTDKSGGFRVTLPSETFVGQAVKVLSRRIGYVPLSTEMRVDAVDSIEIEFRNCREVATPLMTIITGLGDPEGEDGSRLDIEDAAEGGAVLAGDDYIVVLNRGRLFSVSTMDRKLRAVAAVDAFGPGIDPESSYQEHVFASGRNVIVVGSNNRYGGIEIGLFRLDETGALHYVSTYQLRYGRNMYVSVGPRVQFRDGHLIIHSQVELPEDTSRVVGALPAFRTLHAGAANGEFTQLLDPRDIYRPARPLTKVEKSGLQAVTVCSLVHGNVQCHATAVISTLAREVYTSGSATYVWPMAPSQPQHARGGMLVYRFPLSGARPLAIAVDGLTAGADALFESNGILNAVLRSGPTGQWPTSDARLGQVFLLRAPISAFSRAASTIDDARYSKLELLPSNSIFPTFTPRFVSVAMGRYPRRADKTKDRITTSAFGSTSVNSFEVAGEVERMDAAGRAAIATIADNRKLTFKLIDPVNRPGSRDVTIVADRADRMEQRVAADGSTVAAYVIRRSPRDSDENYFGGSSMLLLRVRTTGLEALGEVASRRESNVAEDNCKSSCLDWYGDARTIVVKERIFVVLGYEIIEVELSGGKLSEKNRIDFLREH